MSFRKEEKLKIAPGQLLNLLDWVYENGGEILYAPRTVSSTYFDTDDWRMFCDSEEGCVPRKKIRIRSYTESMHTSENSALEIKTSSVEGRYKTTTQNCDVSRLMSMGYFDTYYGICMPRVRVTYQRSYFSIHGIRLTIDQNLVYAMVVKNRTSPYKISDPDIAVELKAEDSVGLEYLNSQFPFERVRFSKYSRAVNAILTNTAKTV